MPVLSKLMPVIRRLGISITATAVPLVGNIISTGRSSPAYGLELPCQFALLLQSAFPPAPVQMCVRALPVCVQERTVINVSVGMTRFMSLYSILGFIWLKNPRRVALSRQDPATLRDVTRHLARIELTHGEQFLPA